MENFDDEFGDLSGYKILSFEEVTRGFAGNRNPLQGIANKSFEEITYENKFGIKDKCKENSTFYYDRMDLSKLFSHLENNLENEKFFFFYQNYELSRTKNVTEEYPKRSTQTCI